jgi:hypothetical protein
MITITLTEGQSFAVAVLLGSPDCPLDRPENDVNMVGLEKMGMVRYLKASQYTFRWERGQKKIKGPGWVLTVEGLGVFQP